MDLKLRVAKFKARLREIQEMRFETRGKAETAAKSLRKTRRELIRLGAEVTAAEIRVREREGKWMVRVLEDTGGNWKFSGERKEVCFGEPEDTGGNWRKLEGTDFLAEVLERLGEGGDESIG